MDNIERDIEDTLQISLDTVGLLIKRGETIREIHDQTEKLSEMSRKFLWDTRGGSNIFYTMVRCFTFLFPTEHEIEDRLKKKKYFKHEITKA
jgi:hypothetical protein